MYTVHQPTTLNCKKLTDKSAHRESTRCQSVVIKCFEIISFNPVGVEVTLADLQDIIQESIGGKLEKGNGFRRRYS